MVTFRRNQAKGRGDTDTGGCKTPPQPPTMTTMSTQDRMCIGDTICSVLEDEQVKKSVRDHFVQSMPIDEDACGDCITCSPWSNPQEDPPSSQE